MEVATKNRTVPKLRFKEFDGEWGKTQLKFIGEYVGGGTPKTSVLEYWEGNIPWISSSDIIENDIHNINVQKYITEDAIKNSATKKIPANSLIIVSRVGVGKFAINKKEVCTSQDFTNIIIDTKVFDANFSAFNLLKNIDILFNISQGTSIKGFTIVDLKKTRLSFPSLPEQQKIASFLTSVDKKIQQLTKKAEGLAQYKKGVMQQVFKQELRFKIENEDGELVDAPKWEQKKLGKLFERVTTKNIENNTNVLTISAQQGLINQEEYFNKSVSAKDVSGYYLINKNDFAYNKSYSKGYPMGATKRLTRYDKGVVSTLYICFRMKVNNDLGFYDQYFNSGFLNHELSKIAQEGARNHGLLNVSVVEFFKDINLPTPVVEEQTKIANFLTSIDKRIEQANTQLAQTQEFKKGLLQQMFV